jgi:hypothetical protein
VVADDVVNELQLIISHVLGLYWGQKLFSFERKKKKGLEEKELNHFMEKIKNQWTHVFS